MPFKQPDIRPPKAQTVKPFRQSDFAVTVECLRCGDLHTYPWSTLNSNSNRKKPKPGDWAKVRCTLSSNRTRPPHSARAILGLGVGHPFYISF